jgi:hypothetical protein
MWTYWRNSIDLYQKRRTLTKEIMKMKNRI